MVNLSRKKFWIPFGKKSGVHIKKVRDAIAELEGKGRKYVEAIKKTAISSEEPSGLENFIPRIVLKINQLLHLIDRLDQVSIADTITPSFLIRDYLATYLKNHNIKN